jgi:hypothetical protein
MRFLFAALALAGALSLASAHDSWISRGGHRCRPEYSSTHWFYSPHPGSIIEQLDGESNTVVGAACLAPQCIGQSPRRGRLLKIGLNERRVSVGLTTRT